MDTESLNKITRDALAQFTGTFHYYKTAMAPRARYTDGCAHLKANGASWLVDDILILSTLDPRLRSEPFLLWELVIIKGRGVLTASDGNDGPALHQQEYTTDFPLDVVKFYFTDGVLMLASEY